MLVSSHISSLNTFCFYRFHLPPKINVPDVQLELSATQPLRTVVERLKGISPHGEFNYTLTVPLLSAHPQTLVVNITSYASLSSVYGRVNGR